MRSMATDEAPTPRPDFAAANGWDRDGVLAWAAAVEVNSEHPVARAIVTAARRRGEIPAGSELAALTGRGVQGSVDGHSIAVGGPALATLRPDPGARLGIRARSPASEDAAIGGGPASGGPRWPGQRPR